MTDRLCNNLGTSETWHKVRCKLWRRTGAVLLHLEVFKASWKHNATWQTPDLLFNLELGEGGKECLLLLLVAVLPRCSAHIQSIAWCALWTLQVSFFPTLIMQARGKNPMTNGSVSAYQWNEHSVVWMHRRKQWSPFITAFLGGEVHVWSNPLDWQFPF